MGSAKVKGGGRTAGNRAARRRLLCYHVPMSIRFRYIAVEGPIGVGKTTLVEHLSERLGAEKILETANNPFLRDFYQGKPEAAFLAQLFFLLSRYQQQQQLRQRTLFERALVADYLLEKDRIFAYLNLTDSELSIYERLYAVLSADTPSPDLVVYLQAETPALLKRIKERGRDYEKRVSHEYLKTVNDAYNRYFFNYTRTPLLVVNTAEADFARNKEHLDGLMRQIETMEGGTRYYVPMTA